MFRRIESDEKGLEQSALHAIATQESEPIARSQLDDYPDTDLLPRGHPRWVKDGVAISQRARELVARLHPILIRVVRFWDHRVRASVVAGRRVRVDPSGSYQVE